MPLVLGFAGLLGMVLLLTSAITGASFADVVKGHAGEAYHTAHDAHTAAATTPTTGVTGTTNAPGANPVPTGAAGQILRRLHARGVPIYKEAFAALTPGRIDQGKDFGGAGPVKAIADGVVKHVGLWPGWPGTGGVVYDTALGPIFVMEDFAASVRVGQRVRAGDVIGHATGGHSGIEAGLANSSYSAPLTRYNGRADGSDTEGGQAFAALLGYPPHD